MLIVYCSTPLESRCLIKKQANIMPIPFLCDKPSSEMKTPLRQFKRLALFLASGTDCICCLGYRIILATLVGFAIGWACRV